jgi:uncharacterized protein YwgA
MEMHMGLKKRDWALLAIAAADGKPVSPAKLQKSLFILGMESPENLEDFYRFEPYNYGPFDAGIYSDAESLASEGLVEVLHPTGGRWVEYVATPVGLNAAQELKEKKAGAAGYLKKVVDWTQRVTFQELLREVYKHYPQYAVNSVFRG